MRPIIFLLVFSLLFLHCERKNNLVETTDCLNDKIEEILADGVWNPPAKIYSYKYKEHTVYYVPARCCDFPSILYDENCNIICNPDGGFSGGGDGRCNDFFDLRSDEKLIWEDTRK